MVKLNGLASARDRNILTIPERIGELVGIIVVVLVAAFFAYHLSERTGFMTSDFGLTGILLLFGSVSMSIVASGARAIMGKRDKSRPFELASAVYWAIAAVWFLNVLPFNFAHLSDPLPYYMRFFLLWITNDIGWIILLMIAIVSTGAAINAAGRLILDRIHRTYG